MTANPDWFYDYVIHRGLSVGGWRDDEVIVTTSTIIFSEGIVTWGEELVTVPFSLIETDMDEAKAYVDEAARLQRCFGP